MKVPKTAKRKICRVCKKRTKLNLYESRHYIYLECDLCKNASRSEKEV